jgi:hypothetical protein
MENQLNAQQRYYERNKEAIRKKAKEQYVEKTKDAVKKPMGRPKGAKDKTKRTRALKYPVAPSLILPSV